MRPRVSVATVLAALSGWCKFRLLHSMLTRLASILTALLRGYSAEASA
jgi:hypothetical protein